MPNKKIHLKCSLFVGAAIAVTSLAYVLTRPDSDTQSNLVEEVPQTNQKSAEVVDTFPVEYAFDEGGFFCSRYADAKEVKEKLLSGEAYSIAYLIKSDRCIIISMTENIIENVSLLDIQKLGHPNRDLCKVRIYAKGVGGEGWSNCDSLLKKGKERYVEKKDGVILGWGGY